MALEPAGAEPVYDIEVEGTHNFLANGILAHNTYLSPTSAASAPTLSRQRGMRRGIGRREFLAALGALGASLTIPRQANAWSLFERLQFWLQPEAERIRQQLVAGQLSAEEITALLADGRVTRHTAEVIAQWAAPEQLAATHLDRLVELAVTWGDRALLDALASRTDLSMSHVISIGASAVTLQIDAVIFMRLGELHPEAFAHMLQALSRLFDWPTGRVEQLLTQYTASISMAQQQALQASIVTRTTITQLSPSVAAYFRQLYPAQFEDVPVVVLRDAAVEQWFGGRAVMAKFIDLASDDPLAARWQRLFGATPSRFIVIKKSRVDDSVLAHEVAHSVDRSWSSYYARFLRPVDRAASRQDIVRWEIDQRSDLYVQFLEHLRNDVSLAELIEAIPEQPALTQEARRRLAPFLELPIEYAWQLARVSDRQALLLSLMNELYVTARLFEYRYLNRYFWHPSEFAAEVESARYFQRRSRSFDAWVFDREGVPFGHIPAWAIARYRRAWQEAQQLGDRPQRLLITANVGDRIHDSKSDQGEAGSVSSEQEKAGRGGNLHGVHDANMALLRFGLSALMVGGLVAAGAAWLQLPYGIGAALTVLSAVTAYVGLPRFVATWRARRGADASGAPNSAGALEG